MLLTLLAYLCNAIQVYTQKRISLVSVVHGEGSCGNTECRGGRDDMRDAAKDSDSHNNKNNYSFNRASIKEYGSGRSRSCRKVIVVPGSEPTVVTIQLAMNKMQCADSINSPNIENAEDVYRLHGIGLYDSLQDNLYIKNLILR
jgi:hypothetical protein